MYFCVTRFRTLNKTIVRSKNFFQQDSSGHLAFMIEYISKKNVYNDSILP